MTMKLPPLILLPPLHRFDNKKKSTSTYCGSPTDPRKTVGDVRSIYTVYPQKGCFDLEVFGYADGRCPYIASLNIDAGVSVKLIYTTGKPRFVQCIRLICKDCYGTGWQSCEKTLVVKLSKQQQNLLHAVVAGLIRT